MRSQRLLSWLGYQSLLLIDLNAGETYYNFIMSKNPTDLAYFAGYIDGDGCFSIREQQTGRGTKFQSSLIINTVNESNVIWMVQKIGGTYSFSPSYKPGHKPIHRYILSGKCVESVPFQSYLVQKKHEFDLFEKFRQSTSKEEKRKILVEMKNAKQAYVVQDNIKETLESIRNTVQPSIEDYAYLAGFIDAECCLGIQRNFSPNRPNPTYKIQLQLNDTKYPCLFWISKRFGGQFHFVDRSRLKSFHRNQMTWRLSALALSPLLPKILPFLNHKKPVCAALIKFHETTFRGQGHPSPNSDSFSEFYRPILKEREKIFDHVAQLNKKGI